MFSEQFHVMFMFMSYEWWCHRDPVTDFSPWRASLSSWYSPAFSAALRSWTPRSQGVAQATACLWTNSLSDSLPELWWGINIDFSIYLSTKLIYVSFIRTTGNQESDILLLATEAYNILKEKHLQVQYFSLFSWQQKIFYSHSFRSTQPETFKPFTQWLIWT